MRRDKEMRQIALSVSIALSAGVFSMTPIVSAAPVLNEVVSGNAKVDQSTTPQVTDITSKERNNVIDWKDFSVSQGETVRFDKGDKTNNYLNLVSGANASQIDGAIKGGKDVYIVNPNGVVFGETATVDVGSLYVSSRPLNKTAYENLNPNEDMKPLAYKDTSTMSGGDIVNMGTVQANTVFIEGKNIVIGDAERVLTADGLQVNENVSMRAPSSQNISVGRSVSSLVARQNAKKENEGTYSFANTNDNTDGNTYSFESVSGELPLVKNEDDLMAIPTYGLNKSYTLKKDLDFSGRTFTPIGGDKNNAFSGIFDGEYHTISNITSTNKTYAGLFGYTSGGEIKNVGVSGSGNITGNYAGGIAGYANGTKFTNVFNEGIAINMKDINSSAGGLIGYAIGGSISSSYNTGNVTNEEFMTGGIVGYAKNFTITDVYNTGSVTNGLVGRGTGNTLKNGYSTQGKLKYSSEYKSSSDTNTILKPTSTAEASYTSFDISKEGDKSTTWRIYEGQSLPLLRAFLTAHGTVTVNYNYKHGDESGSNGGDNLTANDLTYNGEYVTVNGDPSYSGADSIVPSKILYSNSSVRNAKTKAMFYTKQQGYDLVGNNVTMGKRKVTVDTVNLDFSKVYDGETDVTEKFESEFLAAAGTGAAGGILAADTGSIKLAFTKDANNVAFSAKFVDKNVDVNKKINLTGALTISAKTTSTTDAEIVANYTLDESSKNLANAKAYGTITARPIYLTVTDPGLNKTYDRTADLDSSVDVSTIFDLDSTEYPKGTQSPATGKITGDSVDLEVGKLNPRYVDIGTDGKAVDASNAGAHKVLFNGIKLTGTDAGNYVLQYGDNHNTVTDSQVFLDGVIKPRLITSNGFQVKKKTGVDGNNNPIYTTTEVEKVYDGTSTLKALPEGAILMANTAADETSTTGIKADDAPYLWFELSKGTASYFVDSTGTATDMAAGTNKATGVAYAVDAVTKDGYAYLKGNYTFDETTANSLTVSAWKTLANSANPTVSGTGRINKRNLVINSTNALNIDKDYDGTAAVVGTGYTKIDGDYLKYSSDSYKLLADETGAATDTAAWKVTAEYSDKNVGEVDSDGVAIDNKKNVNFTIALEGADAVNYTINGSDSVILTGKGKIKHKELTPEFSPVSKVYNGTTRINDGENTAVSGKGKITPVSVTSGQTTTTDDVKLAYSDDDAYYDSANAGTWTVYYPNLSLTGTDKRNYKLKNTTGQGTGTITQRTVNPGDIVPTFATIAKTYNNSPAIDDYQSKLQKLTIDGILEGGDVRNSVTVASGVFASKDRLSANGDLQKNGVTYVITIPTTLSNNYSFANGSNSAGTVTVADGTDNKKTITLKTDGKMYQAPLTVERVDENPTKYYDGTEAVVDNLTNLDNTTALTGDELVTITSGLYTEDGTKNATIAEYGGVDAGTQTVIYTLGLTEAEGVNNYKFVDGDGNTIETIAGADITGTIKKRPLTVSFAKVSKIYDGNNNVTNKQYSTLISDVITPTVTSGTTPPSTVATDLETITNAVKSGVSGVYLSTDDTPDENVGDKTVKYTGLSTVLDDTLSKNYEFASDVSDGWQGSIGKAKLGMSDLKFTFGDISREYDGTPNIDVDTANDKVTGHYIDLGGGNKVDFNYTSSAVVAKYTSAGTGNGVADAGTGKQITYTISGITIPDDVAANFEWETTDPFTSTKSYSRDNAGIITPRKVYATITDTLTKVYDTTKDVLGLAKGTTSGTTIAAAKDIVNIEGLVNANDNATEIAYTDQNKGTANRQVQYTIKVTDAQKDNYNIFYNTNDANFADYTKEYNTDGTIKSVTTPKNTITARDVTISFGPAVKTYDGTTDVLAESHSFTTDNATAAITAELNAMGLESYKAAYEDADAGTGKKVTYENIKLDDGGTGNYNVVNAALVTTNNNRIDKFDLSGDLVFTLGTVTKEYDRGRDVKFTGIGADGITYNRDKSTAAVKNYITAPTITVNNGSQQLAYELKSSLYESAAVDTQPATFKIGLSSKNYTFDNVKVKDQNGNVYAGMLDADGVYNYSLVREDATITPRHIYIDLKDTPTISKVYDGTTNLTLDDEDKAAIKVPNNKVYNRLYEANDPDILSGDDVAIDWSNIEARYVTGDVDENIDVIYTVKLKGADKGNYQLYRYADNVADAVAMTDNTTKGKGKITPATLGIDFQRMDKDYDGNNAIIGLAGAKINLTGVNNETVVFADDVVTNNIVGQYADANVSWNGDNETHKGITYTGLQAALDAMVAADANSVFRNYKVANDKIVYSAADGKGMIKALSRDVVQTWTPITRTYNGDTNIGEAYKLNADRSRGAAIDETDVLQLTITAINNKPVKVVYNAAANYDNKDKGDEHKLIYAISGVDKKVHDGTGYNYKIDTTNLNGKTLTSEANNQITPRTINVSVDGEIRKVYDGTRNVETGDIEKIKLTDSVLAADMEKGLAGYSVEAEYLDKNASENVSVNYSVTLTGNEKGNYLLNGNTTNTDHGTTNGAIDKRKVYVSGDNVKGIDKVYDGTTALADNYSNAGRFSLVTRDDTAQTGIIAGEEDIKLDTSGVTGKYDSAHVNRNSDGSSGIRSINFTGFALTDTDDNGNTKDSINNYTFDAAATITGTGTITPRDLSVAVKDAPVKEYDGTQDVIGTYAVAGNITPDGLLGSDTANILIDSAYYTDANAGTGKGYTYNLTLANTDYSLTSGTVSKGGLATVLTGTDGTITKRTLTPTVNGVMTKEYDGTTDGVENAAVNVNMGNRVVSGDNIGLTAVATYDNPNAGKSEDSDELQEHTVTYTLNLSNPNYQLAENSVTGTGTISRKGLTIVANPATVNAGEAIPAFSGSVEGLVTTDSSLESLFTFAPLPETRTDMPGSYEVYGWYSNRSFGNFGLNYTFEQSAGNDTAFTVNYVNNNGNPDTKITPSNDVYNQISKDMSSGFGDNGAAAIEYVDKGGNVIGTSTIDSGEIHSAGSVSEATGDMSNQGTSLAAIGIAGGDIVNMEGADAAASANIEVSGDSTTVNLEVFSIKGDTDSSATDGVAEITNTDESRITVNNASIATIEVAGEMQDVLEEKNKDKAEENERESEIAIKSSDGQNEDEIELKVEEEGVNVA